MRKKIAIPDEARDTLPRLQVTLTDETAWLTRFDDRGRPAVTYPAAVQHIANAFRGFGAETGLLPAETLWWASRSGRTEIAVWLPPVRRVIAWAAGKRVHRVTLPPLGFVWIGAGRDYRIFAALERPAANGAMLYHAPLPNVHPDGTVCPGDVKFPLCTPASVSGAAALFWESNFNHDLSGGKLRGSPALLPALSALGSARRFPADQLVQAVTAGHLASGGRDIRPLASEDAEFEDDEEFEMENDYENERD